MQPAIRIENLSKLYRIGAREYAHYRTLRETLMDVAAAPWRRIKEIRSHSRIGAQEMNGPMNGHSSNGHSAAQNGTVPLAAPPDSIWALNDVSFDVQHGEVVGIIGRNGAGKSTLLKVLSRITEPTKGRVVLNGRVASLLEVGTGFHAELTGRENTYLNGAILGMHRHEIRRKFDAIVDFAGIEQFLDTPVKRYSSGMYVRLAFAVAAHLDPEILIVDEVLAVGDAEFQKKCLGKMHDVAASGRTVLFVSHNMDAVLNLCTTAIFMQSGRSGPLLSPETAIHGYLRSSHRPNGRAIVSELPRSFSATGLPIVSSFEVTSDNGNGPHFPVGDRVVFEIELAGTEEFDDLVCSIVLNNSGGQRVVMFHSLYHSGLSFSQQSPLRLSCIVPSLALTPGTYSIEVGIGSGEKAMLERVENVMDLTVYFSDLWGTGRLPSYQQGHGLIPATWTRMVLN
jgi:lipopolysaccharide transport system ATP-binding protein